MCTELGMHSIVPTPLHVALQEKLTAQLLLDQLPRSHAEPLGQNSSQNGLAVVKICGLHRGTFISSNTAGLAGDDLTDAQGYPPKGAYHGDADTTDHTAIGKVPQGHW